ncbi:hypothetical protein KZY98_12845 [Croceibacter atlanticus]|uniref:hypothetical protein n=1 Tax=Croceibacter atlanticus TaxID=313588 RepID=UPI001C5FA220|nr:hypothetical protein [Croceibacter atlanticus]MBW4971353.1 hypothetical protein [Croceibacter atlanticus]
MKNRITLIITILFVNSIFGQNLENGNELCVINMLGAKVYEKPTLESQTLTKLIVGKNIIIEKIIQTDEEMEIGNGFSLSGNWIKPMNINGYVFSTDLSDKNVEIGKSKYGQTYLNLLGELTNKREEKKLIKTENGEFPKYFEYEYYKYGTYTYTAWDGCFDHVTEYKNLTLNEVYHQMVSDYGGIMNENEFWAPIFQEKSGNYIKFEGEGATQDLKIELKGNGIITVSSYDCT